MKFTGRWLSDHLGTQAHVTGRNIFADVSGHLGPPIVARDQLQRFPPSTMSSNFGVMAEGNNPTSKVCEVRDIDLTVEVQKTLGLGPLCRLDGMSRGLPEFLDRFCHRLFLLHLF